MILRGGIPPPARLLPLMKFLLGGKRGKGGKGGRNAKSVKKQIEVYLILL